MPKRLTTRCTQTLGEGDSHEKVGEFSKQIPEVPRSCFEGVAWIVFFIPRCTNSKTTHYLLLYSFLVQYPKRYHKSSHRGPFETEHPRSNQYWVINPKMHEEHPRPFYMKSSPANQTNQTVTGSNTPTVSLLRSENCLLKCFLKNWTGSISSSPPKFLLMACSTSGQLGSRRCSSAILYTIFTRLSNKNNTFIKCSGTKDVQCCLHYQLSTETF